MTRGCVIFALEELLSLADRSCVEPSRKVTVPVGATPVAKGMVAVGFTGVPGRTVL
jgi:hypothetical protein